MNFEQYLQEPIINERELLTIFPREKNITIFDIGSCEGEDSIKYSRLFPNSKIYAFEPVFENFEKIKKNIKTYNINNVECINQALSDKNGNSDIFISSGHPDYLPKNNEWDYGNKSSSLYPPKDFQPSWLKFHTKEKVKTVKMYDFCFENNIKNIDFIHMDVQGAELLVLKGAENFIDNINMIWLEVSLVEFYENQPLKNEVIDFLLKNNFEIIKDTCSTESGDILVKKIIK